MTMMSVGAVALDVLPDLSRFRSQLQAQLQGMNIPQVQIEVNQQHVGQQLKQTEGRFKSFVGSLNKLAGAAAGAAIGGALVQGISGAIQMDDVTGKLQAQLGLTTQESKRMGDVAGKLFASSYGESMDDVKTAIASVVQNMDGMRNASSASLKETAARAMNVATVMDEDVGNVTRAVAQMMKTGLAKNSQEAFDLITRGAQSGANKAQDLLDTFNEYGTQFRKLGLDGATAMGLIQQGLKGGARDADTVADALKEFSIRAIDGSNTTIEAFQGLGLNAQQMAQRIAAGGPQAQQGLQLILDKLRQIKDPVKQNEIAVGLFGTKAEDMGKALYSLNPAQATQALGQFKGATDAAGKALHETTQARFTAFKRGLQQDVQGALVSTVGWFQRHETTTKALAIAAGILTVAWAGYNTVAAIMAARTALMTSGTVANTIATRTASIASKAWAGAQWVLNAALSANPIGLVVVAIAALIGALVLAYRNCDWFRNAVNAVFGVVRTVVVGALRAIVNFVRGPLAAGFTWLYNNVVRPVFNGIGLLIKAWWNVTVKPIFTVVKWYFQNVLAPVVRWFYNNVIRPVFTSVGNHIRGVYNNVIKPAFDRLKSALGSVGTAFSRGASAIRSAWSKVQDYAKKPINFVINTVYNKGIVGLWNKVMGWLHLPKSLQLGTYPALASGGELSRVQPMKVNRPKAIVGEGRSQYPEYVIPSDPRFRGRATALWQAAGRSLGMDDMQFLAKGGIIGGILDKVKKGASKVFDLGKDALDFITNPKSIFDKLASPILNQAKSLGTSPWGKAAAAIPPRMLGQVWNAAKQLVDAFNSGYGGSANAVVQAAESQLGVPYVWGGTAWNKGLDCSGLTQGAYWHGARKRIPRVTYDQVKAGRPVGSRKDILPGDLIFPHLGHVMMAVTPGAEGPRGTIEAQRTGTNIMYSRFRGAGAGIRRIMDNIPGARGGGGTGTAFATYYWDGHIPTASGRRMDGTTIASPTWPLGTKVQMSVNGRKPVVGTVWDFGPADWVVRRNGMKQMIDLATPLSGKLFGSPNNGMIQYKILSKGTGRTYKGRSPQWGSQLSGFEKGGIAPANSWGVVGEAGPELVRFGKSTQVIDHDTSKQLAGGPLIGTYVQQLPHGTSPEEMIHELEFALRRAKMGGLHRR